jgi:hypothetical protein
MDEYSMKSNIVMEICYVFIYTLEVIISSLLLINSQPKGRFFCYVLYTQQNATSLWINTPLKKAIKLWDFSLYQYATKCNIAIYATDDYQIL